MTVTDTTFDTSVFGIQAPLADMYLNAVAEIAKIDDQIGVAASGSSFMEEFKAQHPEAVEKANEIIESINSLDDQNVKIVVAYMVIRHREFSKLVNTFINENQPKDVIPKVDADTIARLYEERKDHLTVAKNMLSTIEVFHANNTAFSELPECPKGLKGGAPGKRGEMGRKLPSGLQWTIAGEVIPADKKTIDIAKLVGFKSAGELRKAVQSLFPDDTPTSFDANINGRDVSVRPVAVTNGTPVVDDDDDDDDEDEIVEVAFQFEDDDEDE